MPQLENQPDIEGGNPGGISSTSWHHLRHFNLHMADLRPGPQQPTGSTPNQQSQGESNFGDSSGPFFSVYSKAADDEDNKMVERWQKDADGILIFVSPRTNIQISLRIDYNTIDWSILRRSCCAPCRYRSGSEAK
jgi:hypothetical protein